MTQDTKTPTSQAPTQADTKDISAWLGKPLTVTAPTWAFLVAALVALGLLGIALD
ncbi:hypothetical protein [Cognatishimia sp. MH4019]|uniref:hypothetical protein n=1 Tax=Cognatishimia sp. MH4019 TaxID=2854030 RepID=UPI001CD2AFDF|nr:hypothetical protein [Cognatishimia sp. MH4019]